MPRRYGADGTRLWNGKTPEEFTEADAYRFMAETEAVLQRKELMDDPAQIDFQHPAIHQNENKKRADGRPRPACSGKRKGGILSE